jgi:hypothetical protein
VRLVPRDGAEPSLSEVAGAPSPCVDHARVTSAPGRENEMDVNGHDTPRLVAGTGVADNSGGACKVDRVAVLLRAVAR